jgi:hypothetical protein
MKKIIWTLPVLLSLLIASCGPSHKVTSSWVSPEARTSPKKYSTIFIAVLTQNQSAKNIIEDDMAKAAIAKGYKVFKSSEIFAPNFTKDQADKAVILAKVKQLGCDAIITSALVDKQSETRYVPGTVTYAPYAGYGGWGFGGYYGYMYPAMYGSPGYYTTDKTYFIETNMFDVATEKMVYSVQSEAYNPSTITAFSRGYCEVVTKQFTKDLKAR